MLGKEYDKERSFEEYKKYHSDVIKECHRVLTEDGALYWNVAQTPLENGEILPLGAIFYNILKEKKFYLKNWIIWHFEGGLNAKRRLTGRYENVLWMVKDTNNFVFNLDDIRITSKWDKDKRNNPKGKNPTDFWPVDYVWEINRVVNVSKEKTAHPTQFPEKMIKRVIKASSNKGDIVMDIFSGSGTVMKVAQDEERKWIGIDKESKYCKIALKRVMSSITK
jgi:DNA modification methylase